jgi:hypothetical protein
MKLSQFFALFEASEQAENEFFARLITAINLGNHGKPNDIRRVIDDLTKPKQKPKNVDDLMKTGGL